MPTAMPIVAIARTMRDVVVPANGVASASQIAPGTIATAKMPSRYGSARRNALGDDAGDPTTDRECCQRECDVAARQLRTPRTPNGKPGRGRERNARDVGKPAPAEQRPRGRHEERDTSVGEPERERTGVQQFTHRVQMHPRLHHCRVVHPLCSHEIRAMWRSAHPVPAL